ncbi:MAG TPA: tRNA pseudouridine(55) synthase TruB [Patescibacteria group bacterium]|nr:tRNA pseudouridine(55) synthase TruB [Patescibacteria group bacterium]
MFSEVFIINKPLGITSHDVVNRVRKITHERRVGHAGTLDPLASGVLIVLVGRSATKRQNEFMGLPKEYEAEITFGYESDTDDAEGPIHQCVTSEQLNQLTVHNIQQILPEFIGTIQQRPPRYSAIKVGGSPLYKKARRGDTTLKREDIAVRSVQIDHIEILDFTPATTDHSPRLRINIQCQKGVYIRSLAYDIGKRLGVGAYLSALTRTKIGSYTLENALSLDQIPKK